MIKFKHVQNENKGEYHKNNGVCICYEYEHATNKLSFALAQCHKKDAYNKKEGRDQALDHFLKGNKITIRMSASAYKHKREMFFYSIANNVNYNAY